MVWRRATAASALDTTQTVAGDAPKSDARFHVSILIFLEMRTSTTYGNINIFIGYGDMHGFRKLH